jgi:5'-nucleotidase (lipoprotein e(P4) family)
MKKIILILIITSFLTVLFCDKQEGSIPDLTEVAQLYSVLWHQTSAEYHALAYQAYNLARLRLDEDIAKNETHPKAVIVDIDETVLNNAAFNAREILGLTTYSEGFYNWIAEAKGIAIPGALEFLLYAHEMGYEIFYISNRRSKGLTGTIQNLQKLNFPQADSNHVFLKEDQLSKKARRELVSESYEIVLLMGDNLIDFLEVFKHKAVIERFEAVEKYKAEFGSKFIVLPNPMYGEWLKTLYDFDRSISPEEKQARILRYLQTE